VLQPAATFAGEISQIFSVQTAADWHSLRSKDARTYGGGTKRGQEQRSPMGAGPLRSSDGIAHGIIAQSSDGNRCTFDLLDHTREKQNACVPNQQNLLEAT
jgi:hypothetical protein